jgi:hypothetical protein
MLDLTSNPAIPTIDLDRICKALFERQEVRSRIRRDYGFDREPQSPAHLRDALWAEFGQTPTDKPLEQRMDNRQVFKAAVRALGSNSRSWAGYRRREPEIQRLLGDFDPGSAVAAVRGGRLDAGELKGCLTGQTSGADARAMLAWAERLASGSKYYDELCALAQALDSSADGIGGLQEGELLICVAGFLAAPPPGCSRLLPLATAYADRAPAEWKLPGMGYALASEFLRNLGWDGFKPDRHVRRLLDRWVPEVVELSRGRAQELSKVVGTQSRDLNDYIAYSLAGLAISPLGVPRSYVDNLIWALAHYVEKKGHETSEGYLAGQ